LREAVRKRTIADVPIGAFLSGGTDSGLVVALLADVCPEPIRTFSVGFRPEVLSELPEARRVAARYRTQHTEIIVEPSVVDALPPLLEYFGEPFADSSALPTYYVCKAIAGQVKVALSGDGGDELFGGYHEYAWARQADEYLAAVPRNAVWRRSRVLANRTLHRLGWRGTNYGHLESFLAKPPAANLHREMGFSPIGPKPYGPAFDDSARGFAARHLKSAWDAGRGSSLFDTMTVASLGTRLLNDYLVKVDRASMMNSLEVRSPFLDDELATLALGLPAAAKVPGGRPKHLLRILASRLVDTEALTAPKRGFGVPMSEWLRGPLRSFLQDRLNFGVLRKCGLLEWTAVERMVSEHLGCVRDHGDRVWCLLCLEIWMSRYGA
jgi:asparagine synthase (glutamine-hydrolysing)